MEFLQAIGFFFEAVFVEDIGHALHGHGDRMEREPVAGHRGGWRISD